MNSEQIKTLEQIMIDNKDILNIVDNDDLANRLKMADALLKELDKE